MSVAYEYKIVKCPYCKNILVVKIKQKIKLCTYCGRRLKVYELKALAYARSSYEAHLLVKYYKAKEAGLEKKLYGDEGTRI